MEYEGINESWENFKESIQSSNYMQRLSLKKDEEFFREGYIRGFEKREQKQHLIDLSNEK